MFNKNNVYLGIYCFITATGQLVLRCDSEFLWEERNQNAKWKVGINMKLSQKLRTDPYN